MLLSISILVGCASKERSEKPINIPISIKTADQEHQQRMEILPIKTSPTTFGRVRRHLSYRYNF